MLSKEDFVKEVDKIYKSDFEALNEYKELLKNSYGDERQKEEEGKTNRLWLEIGKPTKKDLYPRDIKGFFLHQLAAMDPIFKRFIFYYSTRPEAIDSRAMISQYVSREDETIHLFYHTWLCFALLGFRMGALLVSDILNDLMEDYDYYQYVDIYWLVCKVNGRKCPGIGELRGKLRREREYEDGGNKIHEKKRGTLWGATTLRTIQEGEKKRQEVEVEFFNMKDYQYIDDDFVDGHLCGGIELGFPTLSDRFFSSTSYWSGKCDRLIVKCAGEKKEFKLSLLDKYWRKVTSAAESFNLESTESITVNEDRQDGTPVPPKICNTSEIQIAMAGLAKAAKSYRERNTRHISGHLVQGMTEDLREAWKSSSTTVDFDERLEEEEHKLKLDGYTPDSPEWNRQIEKIKKSRGRISKAKIEARGGELDKEYDNTGNGLYLKDMLASEAMSPEEIMSNKERQGPIYEMIRRINESYPTLLSKLANEETLTPAERKQLQRLRENNEFRRFYEEKIMKD